VLVVSSIQIMNGTFSLIRSDGSLDISSQSHCAIWQYTYLPIDGKSSPQAQRSFVAVLRI
jgi:hypothetical protein